MTILYADSGSTKTHWALVSQQPGMPRVIHTAQTQGLNPLYVDASLITSALRQVLTQVGDARPDEVRFYGSGCSGERVAVVERALRAVLTPMTRVEVQSDLLGAALSLSVPMPGTAAVGSSPEPFIACIMGTGSIAALYDPVDSQLTPMPALGYILGDEGSGAWLGRHVLGDYLKGQMPQRVRQAFEDDYGPITPASAIQHVYQQPLPNRYLATFASFVGRHQQLGYCQELAFRGVDAFWRRNVLPAAQLPDADGVTDVRLVGSVAYHLSEVVQQVALSHGHSVSRIVQHPIEGLVSC